MEAKGQPPSQDASQHQEAIMQPSPPLSLIRELIAESNTAAQKRIVEQMEALPKEYWLFHKHGRKKNLPLAGMMVHEYEQLFGVLLTQNISLPPNILKTVANSFQYETRNAVLEPGRFDAPNATLFLMRHLDPKMMSGDYWIKFYQKAITW